MSYISPHRAFLGRRIALPETRELDRLAHMLEEQGAETLRCPMVAIRGAPDPAPVRVWLMRLPFDDLVLFTGEGLRRLHGSARRLELEAPFLAGLERTQNNARAKTGASISGGRAEIRFARRRADHRRAYRNLIRPELHGRRMGVQLYPGTRNKFIDFLRADGCAAGPGCALRLHLPPLMTRRSSR